MGEWCWFAFLVLLALSVKISDQWMPVITYVCVRMCVCVCVSILSYHLVSYVAVMTTNHNQASKKTAIGPIVIGFFVFVIVGEGTRNAFSDSPCDHVCCCCTLKIKDALLAASFVCIYTDENSFSLCVCVCVCVNLRVPRFCWRACVRRALRPFVVVFLCIRHSCPAAAAAVRQLRIPLL